MKTFDPMSLRAELPAFAEKTAAFYAGEVSKAEYKGFSGLYGSYAQRGGKASMLRLRMTAGQATGEKLAFVARAIREYSVTRVHFTTCQTIQLHDLSPEATCAIMDKAFDAGIITMGGGGDYPRNVMCAPLAGVDPEEYFDVSPYAKAAGQYMMGLIQDKKMPRKLKVAFSGSPRNATHATFRDLGFVAREDGKFDVYSAGGLGNNPRMGVKVAAAIDPRDVLYYVKAMWLTFLAHGNYENRGKARTRYMVEALGGADNYVAAYREKLAEALSGEDLHIDAAPETAPCTGDGSTASGPRILPQKQQGLYAVSYHPIGGQPDIDTFLRLCDAVCAIPGAQLRLAPDEGAYIVNLTGTQAQEIAALTAHDSARSLFETSVSCIGASICQVGVRDSQALLAACIDAVRAANLPDGALPQIHISGCPSSCGTHQTGSIGLRGGVKPVDGKPQPAFLLTINGRDEQGREVMGRELGMVLESSVPAMLVALGQAVAASGMDYAAYVAQNPGAAEAVLAPYIL